MPHFFINSKAVCGDKITVCEKDNYVHIAKSLRARVGEKLLLIDENQIEYETVIADITSEKIIVDILKKYKSQKSLPFDLYLAQSPLRSDAQTFVIEKATELGVNGVYPILTDNCALNKSVITKKIEKWQKTMYEASKQCERAAVPICFELTTLERLVSGRKFDRVLAFCEKNAEMNLHEFCEKSPLSAGESLLVIIGPEGGFSEREFAFFEEHKIPKLTLGNLILKAETAVTVALGNIVYEFENYGKN